MHNFNRTTCACAECVACCKRQPGPLEPSDVAKILSFTGNQPEEIFVASAGGRAMTTDGKIVSVGTITPAHTNGRCVFLDENERCKIHSVAPFGCAYFDTHMGFEEANKRSIWMFVATMDPAYQALRATLPKAQQTGVTK